MRTARNCDHCGFSISYCKCTPIEILTRNTKILYPENILGNDLLRSHYLKGVEDALRLAGKTFTKLQTIHAAEKFDAVKEPNRRIEQLEEALHKIKASVQEALINK